MQIVYDRSAEVAEFVANLIPFCRARGFSANVALGVEHDGRMVGGFVFHDWSPEAGVIEISFAGTDRRWLTRPVLYGMFFYAFNGIGCQLAVSRTPASLTHAVRICRAYGFRQVTIPRLFGTHEDGVISTLTVEDWRANGFHKENAHGQVKSANAA